MKNLNLLNLILISTFAALGQVPMSNEVIPLDGNDLIKHAKITTAADVGKPLTEISGSRALTYYWVNYSDAVALEFAGGPPENFAALPLWPDSTVYVISGTGLEEDNFYWYAHGYVHMFDPISDYIADYADETYTFIGEAEDWFNEDHAFEVDSVRFYYYYDRYNTAYTDTLKVYLMEPTSSVFEEGSYFDNNGNGVPDEGEDILLVLAKYDYIENEPEGTFTEMTFLLDDDDTASFNPNYITIPLDWRILPNSIDHTVGIAFEYIPAQPYSFGDTLLDFSDPPLEISNPLNSFWLLCTEEFAEGDPLSWAEPSGNQDGIATSEVRYNLSPGNWNGYYISTYAYTAPFAFEHAYVDWLIAPEGVNFLASEPSPCVDLTIEFTDLSNFVTDPDDATYFWEFGDGSEDFGETITHTYLIPDDYTVCLTVQEGTTIYDYCKSITVDYCTGINEIEDLSAFSIYPNPASDELNLNLQFSSPQDAIISIANTAGQIVYNTNTEFNTVYNSTIDVSKFPAGIYVLQITSDARVATKNFVVGDE